MDRGVTRDTHSISAMPGATLDVSGNSGVVLMCKYLQGKACVFIFPQLHDHVMCIIRRRTYAISLVHKILVSTTICWHDDDVVSFILSASAFVFARPR